MLESLRVFGLGFLLWWAAFGFAYFNSGIFESIATKYLKLLMWIGTPVAIILLVIHSNVAYGFLASFIGGAWGIVSHRRYLKNLIHSSKG